MIRKSKRLLPVRQLNYQAERVAAKKLAQAQIELQQARQKVDELDHYLSDYLTGLSRQQASVYQAHQLGLYQQFISRLNQAIKNQRQTILQRQDAVKNLSSQWVVAHQKLKNMDKLIAQAQQQEWQEDNKREQKQLDDQPSLRPDVFR